MSRDVQKQGKQEHSCHSKNCLHYTVLDEDKRKHDAKAPCLQAGQSWASAYLESKGVREGEEEKVCFFKATLYEG